MGQIGLFDYENRLKELSEMGDPLEIINRVIFLGLSPEKNEESTKTRLPKL